MTLEEHAQAIKNQLFKTCSNIYRKKSEQNLLEHRLKIESSTSLKNCIISTSKKLRELQACIIAHNAIVHNKNIPKEYEFQKIQFEAMEKTLEQILKDLTGND